jgi:glutamyl-tRNA synthetase/glutamyl-Q tRNA(Asp) synthetase
VLHVSRPAGRVDLSKLPSGGITRFAPAPTGYLHVGHVLNAIYVWGIARAVDARVVLRVEDHDLQRSRPEYERALTEDLAWLGFEPDERTRQSERHALYEDALARLRRDGLIYACDCSRRDIGAEVYPGTCRARGLAETAGRGIRVRMDPGPERFDDLMLGPQTQDPAAQTGDMLLRDRHGLWTYQLAATMDDFAQGVTLVIRGDDLLDSTGRQIRLARLLGRETPPQFLHHPLIMKSALQKVSKSDADTGIRELRNEGSNPQQVIGYTAALAELIDKPSDLDVADLAGLVTCK